jgi:hypothetical protein
MLAKLGERTYHVTWRYAKNFGEDNCHTSCLISEVSEDGTRFLIVQGNAECSIKDQFNKNTGRKLSLSRALLTQVPTVFEPTSINPQKWEPVFSRAERILFWEGYFKMRGKRE